MSTFVRLTSAFSGQPIWINLDLVKEMSRQPAVDNDFQGRAPVRTELWFGGYGDDKEFSAVDEAPEEIAAMGDPENECPQPQSCTYVSHYLAYGGPDLTHGGYHAAERLAAQHMEACRQITMTGICQTCVRHEERLRA